MLSTIQACGDYEKLMNGLFEMYLEVKFKDGQLANVSDAGAVITSPTICDLCLHLFDNVRVLGHQGPRMVRVLRRGRCADRSPAKLLPIRLPALRLRLFPPALLGRGEDEADVPARLPGAEAGAAPEQEPAGFGVGRDDAWCKGGNFCHFTGDTNLYLDTLLRLWHDQ